MRLVIRLFALAGALCSLPAVARAQDCNQPAAEVVTQVPVPGRPFAAIPTADGCTLFVSLTDNKASQVAVLARRGGKVTPVAVVPLTGQATGMALSPDGKRLAVADGRGLTLLDASKMIQGAGDAVITTGDDGADSEAVYVAISPDSRLAAVSDESARRITVYDISAAQPGQPLKASARIPVANGPTGLAFSPDGQRLYAAVQIGNAVDSSCPPEGGRGGPHAQGVLTVIDVKRTRVLAEVPAGCNPVRVVLSDDGQRAYVSARGSNALATFDTARLLTDRTHAMLGGFRVGTAPVGVAAARGRVFVTNSDRFGGGQTQTVAVIDPSGEAPPLNIPAGGFPRELRVTADQKTLLITNFGSGTVELVDLDRLLAGR
jgi:DNA-binding beta-propeller fold protein YncE